MRSWLLRLKSQDERNRLLLKAVGDAVRVRLLIQAGADVNARDKNGETALMLAAEYSDADSVRLLIQAGADVNARKYDDETALMRAAGAESVRLLIQAGADVNAKDKDGKTALMRAAWLFGDAERVRLLIQAGADVDARDKNGETALMLAAGAESVRLLIQAGADVNARDKDGRTVLMLAARGDDADSVRLLIQAGADVNAKDEDGKTALMRAAWLFGDAERVQLLIQAGVDVDARDENGRTALMWAAGYGGDAERVQLLIQAGVDVDARDENGRTALMWAAGYGDADRVRLLIQAGADVDARDKNGETALDIAVNQGEQDVIDALQEVRRLTSLELDSTLPSAPFLDSLHQGPDDTRNETSSPQFTTRTDSYIESFPMTGQDGEPASASGALPPQDPEDDGEEGMGSQQRSAPSTSATNHLIQRSEISWGDFLGKGSFGRVHRALWHGGEVAVKTIILQDHMGLDPFQSQGLEQRLFEEFVIPEVEILGRLRHHYVVQYFGCCMDPPSIVMELCHMGSLSHLLQRCLSSIHKKEEEKSGGDTRMVARMTWRRRLRMSREIASALQYLHQQPEGGGMLHRDLRTTNVVVTKDWTAKVTDVGMSRFADQVSSRSAGTMGSSNIRWMPPEILRRQPFTKASDVYGFGTILWEIMVWHHPWKDLKTEQIAFARVSSDLEVPSEAEWDGLPGPWPLHQDTLPHFAALAARCLSIEPSARPPIEDIVKTLQDLERQEPEDREPRNDSEAHVCCICLQKSPCMAMSECFHLCLCEDCAERVTARGQCPVCRSAGEPRRVYIP